jgi:hypothetical protein
MKSTVGDNVMINVTYKERVWVWIGFKWLKID